MKRFVVVTTKHRSVWAGWTEDPRCGMDSDVVALDGVRHVFYWDAETVGVGGLAVNGPGPTSKIGPAVPQMVIRDVAVVMDTTPESVSRFAAQGWAP